MSATNASGGIGFVGLLTIVLIVLKILGKLTCPWIWVLSPLWISAGLAIFVGLIILAIARYT